MEWTVVESDQPEPEDLAARKPGFQGGDVIGIIAGAILVLMFGSDLVYRGIAFARNETIEVTLSKGLLWANGVLLVLFMGILPLLWVWTTRKHGWRGVIAYLQLDRPTGSVGRSAAIGLGIGVAVGIGLLVVVAIIGLVLTALGMAPENPALEEIGRNLDWALAIIALSLVPAVAEEVLFRGVLQRYIGLWGQAAIFGLLHVYEGFLAVFLTGLLGVVFGIVMKKRWGLWIPIAAHFTFNFSQLALLMIAT